MFLPPGDHAGGSVVLDGSRHHSTRREAEVVPAQKEKRLPAVLGTVMLGHGHQDQPEHHHGEDDVQDSRHASSVAAVGTAIVRSEAWTDPG